MLPSGLLKEYSNTLSFILRMIDIFAIILSGLIAYFIKFQSLYLADQYLLALLISAMLIPVVFPWFGLYESARSRSIFKYLVQLFQALSLVLVILACFAFLTKTGEFFSRSWFLIWSILALLLFMMLRGSMLAILRIMRTQGMNERRVIIVGDGLLVERLVANIHHALWTGFRISTIFSKDEKNTDREILGVKVADIPNNIGKYIDSLNYAIDEIWLALPLGSEAQVKKILLQLDNHMVAIRFVLDIFGLDLRKHSFSNLAGFPALNLRSSPLLGIKGVMKQIEDKLLAFIILLFISPLMVIIAFAIKLSSEGPIIFKQRRHGWDGKIIKVYKFRTMYKHKEEAGNLMQAKYNDVRITPLGKFLRKTSLDELPQFYNVLQGKMSIVGPRPHAVEHNEYYKGSIKAYMQRHKMKPGITGWAQVNGFRGETTDISQMQNRINYDLFYIENWSLWFDVKIIFLTIIYGFVNKNAY